MFLKLRILFTVLAVVCAILILPIGTWLDLGWAIAVIVLGAAFFILMLLCKQQQEIEEGKINLASDLALNDALPSEPQSNEANKTNEATKTDAASEAKKMESSKKAPNKDELTQKKKKKKSFAKHKKNK